MLYTRSKICSCPCTAALDLPAHWDGAGLPVNQYVLFLAYSLAYELHALRQVSQQVLCRQVAQHHHPTPQFALQGTPPIRIPVAQRQHAVNVTVLRRRESTAIASSTMPKYKCGTTSNMYIVRCSSRENPLIKHADVIITHARAIIGLHGLDPPFLPILLQEQPTYMGKIDTVLNRAPVANTHIFQPHQLLFCLLKLQPSQSNVLQANRHIHSI